MSRSSPLLDLSAGLIAARRALVINDRMGGAEDWWCRSLHRRVLSVIERAITLVETWRRIDSASRGRRTGGGE